MATPDSVTLRLGGNITVPGLGRARLMVGPFLPGDIVTEIQLELVATGATDPQPASVYVSAGPADQRPVDDDDTFDNLPQLVLDSAKIPGVTGAYNTAAGDGYVHVRARLPVWHFTTQRGRWFVVDIESEAQEWTGSVFVRFDRLRPRS
jgi:hypothetical protein